MHPNDTSNPPKAQPQTHDDLRGAEKRMRGVFLGFPADLPPEMVKEVNRLARLDMAGKPVPSALVMTYTRPNGRRVGVVWRPDAEWQRMHERGDIERETRRIFERGASDDPGGAA